jgi:hypothetical protein
MNTLNLNLDIAGRKPIWQKEIDFDLIRSNGYWTCKALPSDIRMPCSGHYDDADDQDELGRLLYFSSVVQLGLEHWLDLPRDVARIHRRDFEIHLICRARPDSLLVSTLARAYEAISGGRRKSVDLKIHLINPPSAALSNLWLEKSFAADIDPMGPKLPRPRKVA